MLMAGARGMCLASGILLAWKSAGAGLHSEE